MCCIVGAGQLINCFKPGTTINFFKPKSIRYFNFKF